MTSFAAGEYQLLLLSLGAVRRRGPGGRSVRRARATCSPQYNRPPYDDIRSRRLAVGHGSGRRCGCGLATSLPSQALAHQVASLAISTSRMNE